ncbi:hypothetical protein F5146DRAFT_945288, partial [Armillaria mellea]
AAKLKEGNALYVKKNFTSAIAKHIKPIALDDKNAVLYANRSACHQPLKRSGHTGRNCSIRSMKY